MNLALKKFLSLSENELNQKYEEIYDAHMNQLMRHEVLAPNKRKITRAKYHRSEIQVHCRKCSCALFIASALRYREPSYYCSNTYFIKNLITLDYMKEIFYCSEDSCNMKLGRRVPIRRGEALYMIDIDGIKFSTPAGDYEIIKKWSKIKELFNFPLIDLLGLRIY